MTSASRSMDYFVSAEVMEHPFRTRVESGSDPYTEQVFLNNDCNLQFTSYSVL